MKKIILVLLSLVSVFAVALFAASCGGNGAKPSTSVEKPEDPDKPKPDEPENPNDPDLKNFTGISFDNGNFVYDGNEKSITASNVPDGANVAYANNSATDAGVYNATAKITKDGYNDLTLKATLTIAEAEMTGVTFDNAEYVYDGTKKTLTVSGVPDGAAVNYTLNEATDAGVYNATATVTKKNYKTLNLKAVLAIEKADIVGVTFDNATVEYDATPHSIDIVGDIPAEASVKTTYNGVETDAVTEVGEYTVVLTVSGKNYNTLTKTAILKITATEERLFSAVYSGGVYFQNNLDDNKLYLYKSGLSKINNDVPEYLTVIGNELIILPRLF